MQLFKNWIAGEWVDASDGATFPDANPANPGDVIGAFPSATLEDVRRAIAAAQAALPGWGGGGEGGEGAAEPVRERASLPPARASGRCQHHPSLELSSGDPGVED